MLLPIKPGFELSYVEQGQGEPIVFLPGILGDKDTFALTTKHLTDKYRCISVEFAGQGASVIDGLKAFDDFSLPKHAESVIALLDHLGLKNVHLVGLSFGSAVSQYIAANYPEYVSEVVLLGALINNQTFHYRNWNTMWGLLTEDVERFTRLSLGLCYSEAFCAANPKLLELSYEKIERLSEKQLQVFKWHLQHGREFDIPAVFNQIEKHITVIHGDRDLIHPIEDQLTVIGDKQNVDVVVLEGVAHGMHLEAGKQIADELLKRYEGA